MSRCEWDGADAPCPRPSKARGLCEKHYQRSVRAGLPLRPHLDTVTPLRCECDTPAPQPARLGAFSILTMTECSNCRRAILHHQPGGEP